MDFESEVISTSDLSLLGENEMQQRIGTQLSGARSGGGVENFLTSLTTTQNGDMEPSS